MRFRDAYDPFRALGGAWTLVRRAPAVMLTGGLVLAILESGWSLGFEVENEDWAVALGCAFCAAGVVIMGLLALFNAGVATAVERVAVQGEARMSDVFRARGRFWPMVLGGFLIAALFLAAVVPLALVALAVGVMVSALGGEEAGIAVGVLAFLLLSPALIYVGLGLALVPEAIALERLGPFEAVARGWRLARGNRLWLFWFSLVLFVFELLGLCCCCVGVLATTAFSKIARFEAYLRLVRDDHELWAVEGGAGAPLRSVPAGEPDDPGW